MVIEAMGADGSVQARLLLRGIMNALTAWPNSIPMYSILSTVVNFTIIECVVHPDYAAEVSSANNCNKE